MIRKMKLFIERITIKLFINWLKRYNIKDGNIPLEYKKVEIDNKFIDTLRLTLEDNTKIIFGVKPFIKITYSEKDGTCIKDSMKIDI